MIRKAATKYSNEQLMRALQAVKEGSSQFSAAKKYGVPRSTLFNKVSGKSVIGKKSGPGTVLSAKEEDVIEKWVLCLAERGFPVVKRQLLHSIQLYLIANERKNPFVDNLPGRRWYKNFLKRHPIIAKRLSQNLSKCRAVVTEGQLKAWHAEVHKYCEENNLLEALNDPTRVFNMDEKGFILTPKNEVVLAKKGQKAVYNRCPNDEKECVTALLGGNAAGMDTPPMLVYAYKRMPSNILLHLPAKWSVGISENGWQTQKTFYDYMTDVFHKWLLETKIKLPVILFIDGHKSHISLTLSEFCSDHQIELIALYPNATHVIQPMDVVVFKPLGGSFAVKAKDWRISHEFAKIDKKDIAPILAESIKSIDYSGLLRKGFERCGLFPFKADNINFSRLIPLTAASASYDQLFNDKKDIAVELNPSESEQAVLSRLQHFEELIDESTLNSFRLSTDEWAGSIEYTALYAIWKKLYEDASAYVLADEGNLILDVETLDLAVGASIISSRPNDAMIFVVGENGQLLKSDGKCFGKSVHFIFDFKQFYDIFTDTDCLIEDNAIVSNESLNFDVGDLVEFIAVEKFTAAEAPRSIVIKEGFIAEGKNFYLLADEPIQKLFFADAKTTAIAGCNNMEIDEPRDVVNEHFAESKNDLKPMNKPLMSISYEQFDENAFKKSFLMPQLNVSKTKKKHPKGKQSTVITSEAWKESEKKKLEEKQRLEAEKEGRKQEREQKKIMAAQVKAEKAVAREKKKIEKAEMEAEKRKKKNL